jgi:hypothetical protein
MTQSSGIIGRFSGKIQYLFHFMVATFLTFAFLYIFSSIDLMERAV